MTLASVYFSAQTANNKNSTPVAKEKNKPITEGLLKSPNRKNYGLFESPNRKNCVRIPSELVKAGFEQLQKEKPN